jgi:hypothetical protein
MFEKNCKCCEHITIYAGHFYCQYLNIKLEKIETRCFKNQKAVAPPPTGCYRYPNEVMINVASCDPIEK